MPTSLPFALLLVRLLTTLIRSVWYIVGKDWTGIALLSHCQIVAAEPLSFLCKRVALADEPNLFASASHNLHIGADAMQVMSGRLPEHCGVAEQSAGVRRWSVAVRWRGMVVDTLFWQWD